LDTRKHQPCYGETLGFEPVTCLQQGVPRPFEPVVPLAISL